MKPDFYLDSLKFSSKWFLKPKKVKSVSIFKYLELAKLFFFNCGQAKQDKKNNFRSGHDQILIYLSRLFKS